MLPNAMSSSSSGAREIQSSEPLGEDQVVVSMSEQPDEFLGPGTRDLRLPHIFPTSSGISYAVAARYTFSLAS